MKSIFLKLSGALVAMYVLSVVRLAEAASITSGDSIISRPVGQGILPGGGSEGSDIQSSVIFAKIIPFLISWSINLAIGLSVIALIFGGYLYLTAYGDQEKRDRGLRTFFYAVIGLVVAMTAYGIVTIITRIQFS